jgi:hypothetical protein
MKSQFTSLRFIKEKEMQRVEMEMMVLNEAILGLQKNIGSETSAIMDADFPQNGVFSQIALYREIQKAHRYKILQLNVKIEEKRVFYEETKERLEKLNVEFEKLKYLEKIENDKKDRELKKKEIKLLDELGLMTLSYRG